MIKWSATKPEPTVENLRKLAHTYGIENEQDAVWMDEFTLKDVDRRVDVVTIDLGKLQINGFEIKVSRSDFLKDDKWQTYLRYFNRFFFVTPPGLIKPDELPPEIYLLEWNMLEHRPNRYEDDEPGVLKYRPELKIVKRGKRLQPRFVRETYGEHFFHGILLAYVRNLRWRTSREGKLCVDCGGLRADVGLSA